MEEQLTPRQVAEALNVSESSVKRWCDRGAIPTVRTVGGHRRIPLDGLLRFLEKTNRQVLIPGSLKAVDAADEPSRLPADPSSIDELLPRFEKAIADGNEDECRSLLSKYYARCESFARLADELVAAAFERIGQAWDCGDLAVYQERRGCEICYRLLHEFRRILPEAAPNAPLAIGGAPEGDNYTLANQLIELVLRENDWRATSLGCNLPLSTVAEAAKKYRPKLVWLSVSHLQDEAAFLQDYTHFIEDLPENTHVVLGGRSLHDQIRPKLKYTAHCDNMQQLAAFASALHGRSVRIRASDN